MTDEGAPAGPARVAALVTGGLLPLVAFAVLGVTMALRVAHPYALEWQETAMLDHARRAWMGEAIYVVPGPDFAPFPYPPLFHWVGAVGFAAFGAELWVLRGVSIVATLALCGMLGRIGASSGVERPTSGLDRILPGVAAAGVFAASYGFSGAWFDVARVDSLALALGLAAVLLARRTDGASVGPVRYFAAGLALAAGVLTKQTLLGIAVAVPVALLLRRETRRGAFVVGLSTAIALAVSVAWFERRTDGAFLLTTVDLLAGSPWHAPAVVGFWGESAPLVMLPVALWVLGGFPRPRGAVVPLASVALVLTGWAGRAHEGGYLNTLMPVALAAALGAATLLRTAWRRAAWTTSAVLAASMLFLLYDPRPLVPTAADRAEGARVARRIAEASDGTVWQPGGAVDAHRHGLVHRMAIVDLLKSREFDAARDLVRDLERRLDARAFDAIVLSHGLEEWGAIAPAIQRNYVVQERLDDPPPGAETLPITRPPPITRAPLTPPSGAPIRPRLLMIPRSPR